MADTDQLIRDLTLLREEVMSLEMGFQISSHLRETETVAYVICMAEGTVTAEDLLAEILKTRSRRDHLKFVLS